MSKLNALIISFCLLLSLVIFIVMQRVFGDVYEDLLINLCAGILTVGFTVFLVDVMRERARKNRVDQLIPVVCEEIRTSSNSILSLITLRMHRGDEDLVKKMYDIRDRAAWNEATEVLLQRTVHIDEVGASYLKNFDPKYMKVLYNAVKLEEKNLLSIYTRYPSVVEDPEFAKAFADLTRSVRLIVWAYEEISSRSKGFVLAYGKAVGLSTEKTSEIVQYHMSSPVKLFVNNYYTFVLQFSKALDMPKDLKL